MRTRAFRALRPSADHAAQVSCVPWDTVNEAEARAIIATNPFSFLRVVRPDADLPGVPRATREQAHAHAVDVFKRFQRNGLLRRESELCIYVYQLRRENHAQTGIALCCHVADYEEGAIRRHEHVLPEKAEDRAGLIDRINANAGPIFLTYRDDPEIERLVNCHVQDEPLFDFMADDGVGHTVWRVPGGDAILEAFRLVPALYVADGHHRAGAAVHVAAQRRAANRRHSGSEGYNWFLAVLFPAGHLRILPYNRVIRDLGGLTPQAFLAKLDACFGLRRGAPATPARAGEVCILADGQWSAFTLREETRDGLRVADAGLLQEQVIGPLLGIADPRHDPRIDFVGGSRGTRELERLVTEGGAAAAFSMYPASVRELMDTADAGGIMPPKSTWFEPKLRSGLLVHTLDD